MKLTPRPYAGETNKHRYVLATQSQELRQKLRTIPAVPIVHINRSVMILEPPSDATLRAKALVRRALPCAPCSYAHRVCPCSQEEEKALHPTAPEAAKLPTTAPTEPPRKKKKGPKGPNPLSVKKKKPKPEASATAKKVQVESKADVGEKRKREDDDGESSAPHIEPTGHKRKRRRTHGGSSLAEAHADHD